MSHVGKKLFPASVELSKYFFTSKPRETSKVFFSALRATSFTESGTDFRMRLLMRFLMGFLTRFLTRFPTTFHEMSSKKRHGPTIDTKQ